MTETVVVEVPVVHFQTVEVERVREVDVTVNVPVTVLVDRLEEVEVTREVIRELPVTRIVERDRLIDVPVTVLVEREVVRSVEIEVTRQVPVTRVVATDRLPSQELDYLCRDYQTFTELDSVRLDFWTVKRRVARNQEERNRAESILGIYDGSLGASGVRRTEICGENPRYRDSTARGIWTIEGIAWCHFDLSQLRIHANPPSWDLVTLDEQDAVAAWVASHLHFCRQGDADQLAGDFEGYPSLMEILRSLDE